MCKSFAYLRIFFARLWKFNPMHANSFDFRDSSHFLFFSIFNILNRKEEKMRGIPEIERIRMQG
jgi:hypothetical protein